MFSQRLTDKIIDIPMGVPELPGIFLALSKGDVEKARRLAMKSLVSVDQDQAPLQRSRTNLLDLLNSQYDSTAETMSRVVDYLTCMGK